MLFELFCTQDSTIKLSSCALPSDLLSPRHRLEHSTSTRIIRWGVAVADGPQAWTCTTYCIKNRKVLCPESIPSSDIHRQKTESTKNLKGACFSGCSELTALAIKSELTKHGLPEMCTKNGRARPPRLPPSPWQSYISPRLYGIRSGGQCVNQENESGDTRKNQT